MRDTTKAKTGNKRQATGSTAAEVDFQRFELLRSALYHDARQIFYTRVHKILLFLTVILGSGAVAAFGAQMPFYGQIAGIIIAVIGAVSLVWDYSGTAKDHAELRRRFYGLLSDVEAGVDMVEIKAKMIMIYADEPPVSQRCNKKAHDRAGYSIYGDDFIKA